MKGLVRTLFVSSLLLFGAFTASPAAADDPPAPLQLGLGDSWAFGFGDTPGEGGYVTDLNQVLKEDFNCSGERTEKGKAGCPQLQLLNLAQPGATTRSMINNQLLPQEGAIRAIPLLESRNQNSNPRDDVEVTTVHTGGNDVFIPIIVACGGGFNSTCVATINRELGDYRLDLTEALDMLRGAAGSEAIVIGTYDNPFRFTPCTLVSGISGAATLADIVLEGAPAFGVPLGLHDIMRAVAAAKQVQVADVYGDLNSPGDWLSSQVPTDCLHPTDSGYDKVAIAFEQVLGVGQSG